MPRNVGGSLLNMGMATKLSDRVAGAKPAQVRYALASETEFDDGESPVSAKVFDPALPHLLVDLEADLVPQSPLNFWSLLSKSTPSVNVGGW